MMYQSVHGGLIKRVILMGTYWIKVCVILDFRMSRGNLIVMTEFIGNMDFKF